MTHRVNEAARPPHPLSTRLIATNGTGHAIVRGLPNRPREAAARDVPTLWR